MRVCDLCTIYWEHISVPGSVYHMFLESLLKFTYLSPITLQLHMADNDTLTLALIQGLIELWMVKDPHKGLGQVYPHFWVLTIPLVLSVDNTLTLPEIKKNIQNC